MVTLPVSAGMPQVDRELAQESARVRSRNPSPMVTPPRPDRGDEESKSGSRAKENVMDLAGGGEDLGMQSPYSDNIITDYFELRYAPKGRRRRLDLPRRPDPTLALRAVPTRSPASRRGLRSQSPAGWLVRPK
jgi:hypothetical protein